jgi:hypothetical protein
MYSDLLQDANWPLDDWERARRIGDSLSRGVGLTLVFHCPPEPLAGHRLQIARTWFIPVAGTRVQYTSDFQWFRPEWVREGFLRYPCTWSGDFARDDPEGMIRYATGTPWKNEYNEFNFVMKMFEDKVVERFFETHGLPAQPEDWL